jgi:hypothetical protein
MHRSIPRFPGEDEIEPRLLTKQSDRFDFGAVATMAVIGVIAGAVVGAIIGALFMAVDPVGVNPWITLFCFVLGGGIVGAVFGGRQTAGPFDHK